MANKILGVFIMAKEQVSSDQANTLGMGIMLEFQFKGGLQWNGAARTAFNANIGDYDTEEYAMCKFIEQDGYGQYLKKSNTAVFWHDTTFPSMGIYCCVLVEGKYGNYPDCMKVFGNYIDKPAIMGKSSSSKAGSSGLDKFAEGLSKECRARVEEGERLEKKGKIEEAIDKYGKAYDMDKGNLYLGTKLVEAMLKSKNIRQHEWAFYVVMQIGQLVPTNTTQEGGYYVILAKSLFVYIKDNNEAKMDKECKTFGTTTRKYIASAISDARYLGVDDPSFKEMEEELNKGAKRGGFFGRRK